MDQPNQSSWEVFWLALAAFAGGMLRYQRWLSVAGKFIWWRPLIDIPGSFVFGAMAYAAGLWLFKTNVSTLVDAGIAGFFGMIGPGAIEAFILRNKEK